MKVYNSKDLKERRRNLRKTQTDAEKLLWRHLRNKQFLGLKFFRQYSVGIYILDFYCPAKKLGIELDGSQHMDASHTTYDENRSSILKGHTIHVIRFWNNEVIQNVEGVLEKIKAELS